MRFLVSSMAAHPRAAHRLSVAMLLTLFGCGLHAGELVRCALAGGGVEYRNPPCPDGNGKTVEIRRMSVGSFKYPTRDARKVKPGSRSRKPVKRGVAKKKRKSLASDKSCWRKRRQLEAVEKRLRRGYRASESVTLRDRRDGYEDYIRRFCGSRGR